MSWFHQLRWHRSCGRFTTLCPSICRDWRNQMALCTCFTLLVVCWAWWIPGLLASWSSPKSCKAATKIMTEKCSPKKCHPEEVIISSLVIIQSPHKSPWAVAPPEHWGCTCENRGRWIQDATVVAQAVPPSCAKCSALWHVSHHQVLTLYKHLWGKMVRCSQGWPVYKVVQLLVASKIQWIM